MAEQLPRSPTTGIVGRRFHALQHHGTSTPSAGGGGYRSTCCTPCRGCSAKRAQYHLASDFGEQHQRYNGVHNVSARLAPARSRAGQHGQDDQRQLRGARATAERRRSLSQPRRERRESVPPRRSGLITKVTASAATVRIDVFFSGTFRSDRGRAGCQLNALVALVSAALGRRRDSRHGGAVPGRRVRSGQPSALDLRRQDPALGPREIRSASTFTT